MLLLIIGLHFVLGSIWLLNNDQVGFGFLCFALGITATHFGWKKLYQSKKEKPNEK